MLSYLRNCHHSAQRLDSCIWISCSKSEMHKALHVNCWIQRFSAVETGTPRAKPSARTSQWNSSVQMHHTALLLQIPAVLDDYSDLETCPQRCFRCSKLNKSVIILMSSPVSTCWSNLLFQPICGPTVPSGFPLWPGRASRSRCSVCAVEGAKRHLWFTNDKHHPEGISTWWENMWKKQTKLLWIYVGMYNFFCLGGPSLPGLALAFRISTAESFLHIFTWIPTWMGQIYQLLHVGKCTLENKTIVEHILSVQVHTLLDTVQTQT